MSNVAFFVYCNLLLTVHLYSFRRYFYVYLYLKNANLSVGHRLNRGCYTLYYHPSCSPASGSVDSWLSARTLGSVDLLCCY